MKLGRGKFQPCSSNILYYLNRDDVIQYPRLRPSPHCSSRPSPEVVPSSKPDAMCDEMFVCQGTAHSARGIRTWKASAASHTRIQASYSPSNHCVRRCTNYAFTKVLVLNQKACVVSSSTIVPAPVKRQLFLKSFPSIKLPFLSCSLSILSSFPS